MDFILVLAAILLASVAVWLWSLGKKQAADFVIGASLTPEPRVFSVPKPITILHRYETIKHLLQVIVPVPKSPVTMRLIGLILAIAGIIYLVFIEQSWIALPLARQFFVGLLLVS
jgi:hypothetical protein